jgi:hypothetical protein
MHEMAFHNDTCFFPDYTWCDISGYSEEEMKYFKKLIQNNAHLILQFSESDLTEKLS